MTKTQKDPSDWLKVNIQIATTLSAFILWCVLSSSRTVLVLFTFSKIKGRFTPNSRKFRTNEIFIERKKRVSLNSVFLL